MFYFIFYSVSYSHFVFCFFRCNQMIECMHAVWCPRRFQEIL
uniref:Uncharacterized protein n=1 Tax=Anguilla anguilla TaxID=7936 RepID=A0A0E9W8M9_ANGAN